MTISSLPAPFPCLSLPKWPLMSGHFDVVGVGQCSVDFLGALPVYPELDGKAELDDMVIQGGGPCATALVTLARLGVDTAFVGRVGADGYGEMIREGLVNEGVDCRFLLTDPEGSSQVAFIVVDAAGHRNIFWHRGSARPLGGSDIDIGMISAASVLHLDGLQLEAAHFAAQVAREHQVATVLDAGTFRPGIEQLLPLIDHPVVSENFARQFGGDDLRDILARLIACGGKAATVTLGGRGSLTLTTDGIFFRMPPFPVDVVDTTGCGDVFHGAYIYGLIQNWPLPRTVRFAGACAALKARALGGRTAIPALGEVRNFLDAHHPVQPVF